MHIWWNVLSITESRSDSFSSSELSWFSSSCLLVHVPIINFFFHDLNNLQLLSSTVQYNWWTKDMWPIQIKSLYCHNTMNASVQVVKVFCANCSMTLWITSIIYIYIYIYIYATHIYKGLNTGREQHMINIILYRERAMKTIINTITIPLQCSTVWISANRMSGCRIIVIQSPVSVSDRVQCIWGWFCGVTGTSSVQSDCLWKELVSQSAGEGSAITSVWW